MSASEKNPSLIAQLQLSEVPVPWCEEFEKMISGMDFRTSYSQVLKDFKFEVMKKSLSFNDATIPEDGTLASLAARRMAVARGMFGKIGAGANIMPPFFTTWGCNIFIGDNVWFNRDCSIFDNSVVTIGDRTLIGPGVYICTDTHAVDMQGRQEVAGTSFARPIHIGEDCWIGARATILPGVRIGRGVTVAAGAVVTKDVEDQVLVGGVPARVIRKLGDAAVQNDSGVDA